MSLTKRELIKVVAQQANVTQETAGMILDAAIEATAAALERGETIRLQELGSLKVCFKQARKHYNPQTKEVSQLDSRSKIVFTPSERLKVRISPAISRKEES